MEHICIVNDSVAAGHGFARRNCHVLITVQEQGSTLT